MTYLALKLLVLGLLLGFVLLNLLCSLTPSVLQLLDPVCIISSCSITPIDPMSSALRIQRLWDDPMGLKYDEGTYIV
jgi:hypothetical protein